MRTFRSALWMTAVLAVALPATAQQTTDADALASHLPDAPTGWSSSDGEQVEGAAVGHEVAQASRVFTNGDVQVEFLIVGSSAMVAASQSMAMVFNNPMMLNQMNSDPAKQFAAISEDGWTGWTVVDQNDSMSEATAFNGDLVVKIDVNEANAEVLELFLALVPWEPLAALNE